MKLYYPSAIRDIAKALGDSINKEYGIQIINLPPLEALSLDTLRCIRVENNRSDMWYRIPWVTSVTDALGFGLLGTNQNIDSVEVILANGDLNLFAKFLDTACPQRAIKKVELQEFSSLSGTIHQEQLSEPIFKRAHEHCTNNPTQYATVRQALLDLPESEWNSIADKVHVGDYWPSFSNKLRPCSYTPRTIIDIGCGLGQMARSCALQYPESRVIGMDISPDGIDIASKKFIHPNLEYAVGSMEDLPGIEPDSVDLYFSLVALNQAVNQKKTAEKVFSTLSPRGRVCAGVVLDTSFAFWNFPESLFAAPTTGFMLQTWKKAAAEYGYALDWESTASVSLDYVNLPIDPEEARLRDHLAGYLREHGLVKQPWACNVFVYARKLEPGEEAPTYENNYLAYLDEILYSATTGPAELQQLTRRIWNKKLSFYGGDSVIQYVLQALLPKSGAFCCAQLT